MIISITIYSNGNKPIGLSR